MRNEFKWNSIFFTFFNLIGHAAHKKLMNFSLEMLHVLHDPSIEQISWLTTLSSKEFLAEEHVKGVADDVESEAVTECDKCEKQICSSNTTSEENLTTGFPRHSNKILATPILN